jgi:Family of unknown function (DUF5681)
MQFEKGQSGNPGGRPKAKRIDLLVETRQLQNRRLNRGRACA